VVVATVGMLYVFLFAHRWLPQRAPLAQILGSHVSG